MYQPVWLRSLLSILLQTAVCVAVWLSTAGLAWAQESDGGESGAAPFREIRSA